MSKKKYFTRITGVLFVILMGLSTVINAENNVESNPFTQANQSEGFMVADGHEGKCGDMDKSAKCGDVDKSAKCGDNMKAEGKCGGGKCGGKGVDMQGNVVELGTFRYGGDNMAKYADGKLATGVKDPAVCGTFSVAKCSVAHLK